MNVKDLVVTVKINKAQVLEHLRHIISCNYSVTGRSDEFIKGYIKALENVLNFIEVETVL